MKIQKSSLKRSAILIVFILLVTSILSGCGSSGKADTVKIGYVNLLDSGPALIEKEQGMMEKQGLKAEYFSFKNGPDLYKALSSGKLDLAFAGIPPAVNWASRGAKFKIIAEVDTGKFGLLTKADSGITKPSDLKGKKIGTIVKGSGVDILERGFLFPEAGLDTHSVTQVEMLMNNMEQAINNKIVDAAVAGEPYLTFAELRGLKVVYDLPNPAFVVLATDDYLKNHAGAVKKFIKGHQAAVNYMHDHPSETTKILADAFKVPSIKSGDKSYTPQEVMLKALNRTKYGVKITDDDMKFYQKVADANYKLKLIDKPLDINSIIDRSWTK